VTSDEPTRPRRLQPRVPRDLEAITLHCLEKEPRHRYPSALALAEDLRRFREGKLVMARPVGAVARLARACRRRPLVTLLLVLLTVSLFGGLGGVTGKWLEANKQRDLANAHARQADAEKQAALYQAYRAGIAAASAALENHDVADAARHLGSAPEALRGWEWRHLRSRLDDRSAVVPLPAREGGFLVAAPDRLRVGVLTSAGLRLTDLEGGEHGTAPIDPERRRHVNVALTRRGLRVAAWVGDTGFDLLDDTGQVLCRVATPENKDHEPANVEVYAVAFHPDGTRLATAARDGAVWLWDLARGEAVARLPRHKSFVWSLAFSPDGTTLASGSGDATVRMWDTAPLKARYQARREAAALRPEAEWLVEQLWREKNDPADVVDALRADRVPSEALRQAALRGMLRRAQPPEAAPGNPHDPP
jgi:hypothetical protein